ncbi:hypothetical protein H0H92_007006 [Tricholoma furcatifolium]|nr:hypothetical protein H0H92_007006 [Tricholoma furcatifolium]
MWAAQRCLRQQHLRLACNGARVYRRLLTVKHETDEYGIPLKPTWSVHELLSSYPKPTLSSATLARLHELAALIPPAEGTEEHAKLKVEMEELIRLVEAVKLVHTQGVRPTTFKLPDEQAGSLGDEPSGRALLRHASRTQDGFYVVDADKKRSDSS